MIATGTATESVSSRLVTVNVQQASSESTVPADEEIQAWIRRAIAASGRTVDAQSEVAVRVVDTDEIRTLNSLYRGQDQATNVLSFPATDVDGLPDHEIRPLGDIVLCAEIVRDEALEQGKCVADHWAHMLVHGTLHLLGFDHDGDAEAAAMEGLEAQILLQRGIANPYASD